MEHQIEIEFIHRRGNILDLIRKNQLVQTRPFEIGLMFRNRGSAPLLGATVSAIRWSSSSGQQIFATINKSFHLDTLNPGEERKIWIEKVGTYVYDLCNISLDIKPDNTNDKIKTFQVDSFTKKIDVCDTNHWIDFFFIRSKNEYEQSKANYLIIIFAFLSLLASFTTLRLSSQQTNYAEIQSRPERIFQAQSVQKTIDICKQNPELKESGLFSPSSGKQASCFDVLQQYGN